MVFEKVKPKWIPVEERLPENSGSYLVTVQNGNVYSATFDAYSKKVLLQSDGLDAVTGGV